MLGIGLISLIVTLASTFILWKLMPKSMHLMFREDIMFLSAIAIGFIVTIMMDRSYPALLTAVIVSIGSALIVAIALHWMNPDG